MFEVQVVNDEGRQDSLVFDTAKVRRFTALEPHLITIARHDPQERARVEALIEQTYAKAYDGRILAHYPTLMSVQDRHGVLLAAAGFRYADEEPLFLEHYLDAPVEQALAQALQAPMSRGEIAEIGNLASTGRGASVFLFMALSAWLERQGRRYATATATRKLRRIFGLVGLDTHTLASADRARLAETADAWGRYYDADPLVLAGAIETGRQGLSDLLATERVRVPDGAHAVLHPRPLLDAAE